MGRLNRYLFKESLVKIGGLIIFAILPWHGRSYGLDAGNNHDD